MASSHNGSGRGGPGQKKKHDGKIADKFRDACPPHKIKDLDALVKQCKGDEEKIQAKIMEWWEEPQIAEPKWEAVDRKGTKRSADKKHHGGFRGDRGHTGGGGGGGHGRRGDRGAGARDGRGGNRGEGRGGRGGSRYGDRDRERVGGKYGGLSQRANAAASPAGPTHVPASRQERGIPTPVTHVPGPKGAWGQALNTNASAPLTIAQVPALEPKPEIPPSLEPEDTVPELSVPVSMVSPEDPTPSGLPPQPKITPTPMVPATTGNVWATRGSAHLIEAEKAKPLPPPVAPQLAVQQVAAPPVPETPKDDEVIESDIGQLGQDEGTESPQEPEEPLPVEEKESAAEPEPEPEPEIEPEPEPTLVAEDDFVRAEDPLVEEEPTSVTLDTVLPPSVNGANINASGWEPILEPPEPSPAPQPPVEIAQRSPVGGISVSTAPSIPEPLSVEEPVTLPEPLSSAAPVALAGAKPSSVLNMGHWETGDADDEALDFGFGSFAPENGNEVIAETTSSTTATAPSTSQVPPPTTESAPLPPAPAAAPPVSPARPPPGLSMPPIPANAILVHELENKLESTSLSQKVEEPSNVQAPKPLPEKKDLGRPNQSAQPQSFNSGNEFGGQTYPGMSQYGGQYGMGMYNYGGSSMAPGTSNGFGSMPPSQFPLSGGASQQQPKPQQSGITSQQQGSSRTGSSPQTLGQGAQQQQGLPYTMHNPAGSAANETSGASSNDGAPNTSAMPPGMPGGIQYPNPAFMYGQYNQMGHPAYAGLQYGYGQGQQFGVQGGFGYHQVMGQGGGYGTPYDDQVPQHHGGNHSSHLSGTNHQYQKGGHGGGGGGYRGGRSHHQSSHGAGGHQYGNNYQAQNLGGYGGGPYNMGYGHDAHFNQRGGYGPSGMDHYGMQQQGGGYQLGGGGVGFSHQDNPDHKGKSKGPHRIGGQQFQQQSHIPQQPLGLQGSSAETGTAGSGGWPGSAQNWGGNWQQDS